MLLCIIYIYYNICIKQSASTHMRIYIYMCVCVRVRAELLSNARLAPFKKGVSNVNPKFINYFGKELFTYGYMCKYTFDEDSF